MKRLHDFKYAIVAAIAFMTAITATAAVSGDKEGTETALPAKAKTFITEYLAGEKVVKSKKDGDKYKIECSSGTKVEFDKNGMWHEIKNGKHGISSSAIKVLPNAAVLYLQNNYNEVAVKKIEKKPEGYMVELDTAPDKCEILFAKEGNVKKIMHDN